MQWIIPLCSIFIEFAWHEDNHNHIFIPMNTGNIYMVGRERRWAAIQKHDLQLHELHSPTEGVVVLMYDRPICKTSALSDLNCLEATTARHRQSITAKFTRSGVVSEVCEERQWMHRHSQIYILRTKLVLSMGDSEMTGTVEQLTRERQMHDLRRNSAEDVFGQAIKTKIKIVTSTECKLWSEIMPSWELLRSLY